MSQALGAQPLVFQASDSSVTAAIPGFGGQQRRGCSAAATALWAAAGAMLQALTGTFVLQLALYC